MGNSFGDCAAQLCTAASVVLGWRPHEFWSATPAELATALQTPTPAAGGLDRRAIDELRQRFPDE